MSVLIIDFKDHGVIAVMICDNEPFVGGVECEVAGPVSLCRNMFKQ